MILLYGAEGHTTGGSGCVASEDGASFVARRAMNLHGCALPHSAPPPAATPPKREHLALRTVSSQHRIIARTSERTEQGGPRSGGRSCGTGGDLALFIEKDYLGPVDVERTLGDNRMARLLDVAGEPRPDATGDAPCGEAKIFRADKEECLC